MSDRQWYENPSLILQVHALASLRDQLREENLFEGEGIRPTTDLGEPSEEAKRARTADGTFNDLSDPWMGAAGTFALVASRIRRWSNDESTRPTRRASSASRVAKAESASRSIRVASSAM